MEKVTFYECHGCGNQNAHPKENNFNCLKCGISLFPNEKLEKEFIQRGVIQLQKQ
tara:strand:- start:517 stop:681 length:165 start_codon:yes stop_codon:yes gene_type:complete